METIEDIKFLQKYTILEKFGQGSFGSILKVQNKENNKIYALKQISLNGINEEELDSIKNEAAILSSIKHENIVNYYGSFTDDKYLNIFMEYCEASDKEN
jgi:NIMA (never in mitosis gene a)-related kinase